MNIDTAAFITSSVNYKKCPPPDLPEFAFIGRSNTGKSSMINMLTGRKGLAKVSGTPGKTRQINHFLINDKWYLADLPGIGFAQISRSERLKMEIMIEGYLLHRASLKQIFLLIDSRHEPQKIDLNFMAWLMHHSLPFCLLFTKTDKLTLPELSSKPAHYKKIVATVLGVTPEIILTSSKTRKGRDEIFEAIEEFLSPGKPRPSATSA